MRLYEVVYILDPALDESAVTAKLEKEFSKFKPKPGTLDVFLAVKPLAVGPLFAGFIAAQLVTFAGLLMRDEQEPTEQTSNTNGE